MFRYCYRLSLDIDTISTLHLAQPTGKISQKMANALHHLEVGTSLLFFFTHYAMLQCSLTLPTYSVQYYVQEQELYNYYAIAMLFIKHKYCQLCIYISYYPGIMLNASMTHYAQNYAGITVGSQSESYSYTYTVSPKILRTKIFIVCYISLGKVLFGIKTSQIGYLLHIVCTYALTNFQG